LGLLALWSAGVAAPVSPWVSPPKTDDRAEPAWIGFSAGGRLKGPTH